MRKQYASLLMLLVLLGLSPVLSAAESAAEICTAEAQDAGIEDADERSAFMADCIEQVSLETGEATGNEDPAEPAESASTS